MLGIAAKLIECCGIKIAKNRMLAQHRQFAAREMPSFTNSVLSHANKFSADTIQLPTHQRNIILDRAYEDRWQPCLSSRSGKRPCENKDLERLPNASAERCDRNRPLSGSAASLNRELKFILRAGACFGLWPKNDAARRIAATTSGVASNVTLCQRLLRKLHYWIIGV